MTGKNVAEKSLNKSHQNEKQKTLTKLRGKYKTMKTLAIMAILLTGTILIGTNQTIAQKTCSADDSTEETYKKCWIKQAKSGNKNLRDAYLSSTNLQNVDFSNADLTNLQMVNANLSGANFSGANLTNANLGNTNFTGANFKGANLTNANLGLANLTNADFTSANLNGINFPLGAKIGGAKLDLTKSQCKVTTKGKNLNTEDSDGKVYGSLKNGTIVYKNGNNQPWDKGRISVNKRQGDELVDVGLVDGKLLTCNTPTKVTSDKTIKCKVKTRGANLNARSLERKLLFTIENSTEVYVFEKSKDGRAKVSVFNDDSDDNKFVGWVPLKYLSCKGN